MLNQPLNPTSSPTFLPLDVQFQPYVTVSKLIDPCRISLSLDSQSKEDGKFKDSKLNLDIEPIYFRIGFLHIDFANVVMAQVNQTLAFVKGLQTSRKTTSTSSP